MADESDRTTASAAIQATPRRSFTRRLVPWIIPLCGSITVLGVLGYAQTVEYSHAYFYSPHSFLGWPLVEHFSHNGEPWRDNSLLGWRHMFWACWFNLGTTGFLALGTLCGLCVVVRRASSRPRMNVYLAVCEVAIVAALTLTAWSKSKQIGEWLAELAHASYYPNDRWWITVTWLFAVACMSCALLLPLSILYIALQKVPRRIWNRSIALCAGIAVLAVLGSAQAFEYGSPSSLRGWPFPYTQQRVEYRVAFPEWRQWYPGLMCVDLVVILTFSLCTATVCHKLAAHTTWPPRFQLSSLLWFMFFLAMSLSLHENCVWIGYWLISWHEIYDVIQEPWWLTATWIFAMACTVYVLLRVAMRGILRASRAFRLSTPV